MGEFGNLKIFNNIPISPEVKKPPVIGSKNLTLTTDEVDLLSRGPKFALRYILNKELFMADLEKGNIKKKYGDIG